MKLNPRERLSCISKLHDYYQTRPAEFDLLTDDSTKCSENNTQTDFQQEISFGNTNSGKSSQEKSSQEKSSQEKSSQEKVSQEKIGQEALEKENTDSDEMLVIDENELITDENSQSTENVHHVEIDAFISEDANHGDEHVQSLIPMESIEENSHEIGENNNVSFVTDRNTNLEISMQLPPHGFESTDYGSRETDFGSRVSKYESHQLTDITSDNMVMSSDETKSGEVKYEEVEKAEFKEIQPEKAESEEVQSEKAKSEESESENVTDIDPPSIVTPETTPTRACKKVVESDSEFNSFNMSFNISKPVNIYDDSASVPAVEAVQAESVKDTLKPDSMSTPFVPKRSPFNFNMNQPLLKIPQVDTTQEDIGDQVQNQVQNQEQNTVDEYTFDDQTHMVINQPTEHNSGEHQIDLPVDLQETTSSEHIDQSMIPPGGLNTNQIQSILDQFKPPRIEDSFAIGDNNETVYPRSTTSTGGGQTDVIEILSSDEDEVQQHDSDDNMDGNFGENFDENLENNNFAENSDEINSENSAENSAENSGENSAENSEQDLYSGVDEVEEEQQEEEAYILRAEDADEVEVAENGEYSENASEIEEINEQFSGNPETTKWVHINVVD